VALDPISNRPPGVSVTDAIKAVVQSWLASVTMTFTNKTLTSPAINTATLTDPRTNTILDTGGATALLIPATASAVNYFQLTGATGASLVFKVAGTGNNLSMNHQAKGTGSIRWVDGNSAIVAQSIAGVASAVNYVELGNAAAGKAPIIRAGGSDTNANLDIRGRGTGVPVSNGNPLGIKVAVPASAAATGVPGQWAVDATYAYFCTAANTWVRAAVATW